MKKKISARTELHKTAFKLVLSFQNFNAAQAAHWQQIGSVIIVMYLKIFAVLSSSALICDSSIRQISLNATDAEEFGKCISLRIVGSAFGVPDTRRSNNRIAG